MPSFVGYEQKNNLLSIHIPVSDDLIRNACDVDAVAKMASELAGKSASDAILATRKKFESAVPSPLC